MDGRIYWFLLIFCCFHSTQSTLEDEFDNLRYLKRILTREKNDIFETRRLAELLRRLLKNRNLHSTGD